VQQLDDHWVNHALEYSWHVIFGEKWQSTAPDAERLFKHAGTVQSRDDASADGSGTAASVSALPSVMQQLAATQTAVVSSGSAVAGHASSSTAASDESTRQPQRGVASGGRAPTPSPSSLSAPPPTAGLTSQWLNAAGGTVVVAAKAAASGGLLSQQPIPFVVMTAGYPPGSPDNVPFIGGGEVAAYLAFIVQNYDDMPLHTVFVDDPKLTWRGGDVRVVVAATAGGVCVSGAVGV
jgi:hypothetical protein